MQAKRRPWRALIASLLVLAGCGGGGGGDEPPSPQPSNADVGVTGTALVPVVVGGGLADYRLTVANAGPEAASHVTLAVALDGGQTLGAVACAASGGASCPTSLGATMTVPSLPAGGTLAFSVPGTIPADSGSFSGTMTATVNGDPIPANNSASARVTATAPNRIRLQSDFGDYIGAGGSYSYSRKNAVLTLVASGGRLTIGITGDQNWNGTIVMPQSQSRIAVGQYTGLTRFGNGGSGALDWSGEGRGCNVVLGSVTVTRADYLNDALVALGLTFEQHCEGAAPALRGQIDWTSADNTPPDGPLNPPPAGLWAPAAGAVPASGNYFYMESEFGDYIGAGATRTFTSASAILAVSLTGGRINVRVSGDENWDADFQAMVGVARVLPGYYGNLRRYPFHNPVLGGLSVAGEGRGCNTLTGWFVVDAIALANGVLTAVDLRFEQHCEGGGPALRGRLRWSAGDAAVPPGPVNPPPAGLWAPAAGATPASGNYFYTQSDAGDYIGGGATYTYTQASAILGVTLTGNRLGVSVQGDQNWNAEFQAMNSISQLQPGYYGNLRRYPFHNPVRGGLSISGQGRGCNTLTGWFVVDSISLVDGALSAIELRFEQHCEGMGPALRGKLRWAAGDTSAPPGPVNPPPAGLWAPASGATPASGNYFYMQSDAGDYIGGGGTHTFTQANAILTVGLLGNRLGVSVQGDQSWSAEFQAMVTLSQLQPGYYGNLQRYPFHNPIRGGLSVSGNGRGCNTLTGWFVVDSISVVNGALAAIELRFEQHCEGMGPALRGKLRWATGDSTAPPGPVNPPPAGLWAPAQGATPASGNYFYMQSDAGDYVGAGLTYTFPQAGSTWSVTLAGARIGVLVQGTHFWSADFQGMNGLTQLQPGYYGNLQRHPFHNPVRGGLSIFGNGRGCNTLTGWFVVDAITITGGVLDAIDLRFEQHCEGAGPALRGKLHWTR